MFVGKRKTFDKRVRPSPFFLFLFPVLTSVPVDRDRADNDHLEDDALDAPNAARIRTLARVRALGGGREDASRQGPRAGGAALHGVLRHRGRHGPGALRALGRRRCRARHGRESAIGVGAGRPVVKIRTPWGRVWVYRMDGTMDGMVWYLVRKWKVEGSREGEGGCTCTCSRPWAPVFIFYSCEAAGSCFCDVKFKARVFRRVCLCVLVRSCTFST